MVEITKLTLLYLSLGIGKIQWRMIVEKNISIEDFGVFPALLLISCLLDILVILHVENILQQFD